MLHNPLRAFVKVFEFLVRLIKDYRLKCFERFLLRSGWDLSQEIEPLLVLVQSWRASPRGHEFESL